LFSKSSWLDPKSSWLDSKFNWLDSKFNWHALILWIDNFVNLVEWIEKQTVYNKQNKMHKDVSKISTNKLSTFDFFKVKWLLDSKFILQDWMPRWHQDNVWKSFRKFKKRTK